MPSENGRGPQAASSTSTLDRAPKLFQVLYFVIADARRVTQDRGLATQSRPGECRASSPVTRAQLAERRHEHGALLRERPQRIAEALLQIIRLLDPAPRRHVANGRMLLRQHPLHAPPPHLGT